MSATVLTASVPASDGLMASPARVVSKIDLAVKPFSVVPDVFEQPDRSLQIAAGDAITSR